MNLQQVIESNLRELLETKRKASAITVFYLDVLISYLKGDTQTLQQLANTPNIQDPEKTAAKLRLQIRTRSIQEVLLEHTIRLAESTSDLVWRGELYFILALAYEVSAKDHEARDFFKLSSETLELAGCRKKSLKAFANYIAAETRANPEKKLIVEYDYVYRKAKQLKELGVAGMALNNISREYQRAGALNLALKTVTRAIACLKQDFGSLHYYLAIVHRAHVLLDLKREREASLDLEQAATSDFPEIKEAVKILQKLYSQNANTSITTNLTNFTWRERITEGPTETNTPQFSETEEKVVRLLATGSYDKFEIIEHLYGKTVDFESAENRFKNLIGRIRKKQPGLIAFSDGKYQIADESFLPLHFLKAAG